jgi:hypothetical protein
MLGEVVTIVLCLTLRFLDVEDDGSHNYLVEQKRGSRAGQWHVAFQSPTDVKWRDGCYLVTADCDLRAIGLIELGPGDNSWGESYVAPICNAHEIQGDNFHWTNKKQELKDEQPRD